MLSRYVTCNLNILSPTQVLLSQTESSSGGRVQMSTSVGSDTRNEENVSAAISLDTCIESRVSSHVYHVTCIMVSRVSWCDLRAAWSRNTMPRAKSIWMVTRWSQDTHSSSKPVSFHQLSFHFKYIYHYLFNSLLFKLL